MNTLIVSTTLVFVDLRLEPQRDLKAYGIPMCSIWFTNLLIERICMIVMMLYKYSYTPPTNIPRLAIVNFPSKSAIVPCKREDRRVPFQCKTLKCKESFWDLQKRNVTVKSYIAEFIHLATYGCMSIAFSSLSNSISGLSLCLILEKGSMLYRVHEIAFKGPTHPSAMISLKNGATGT